MTGKLIIEHIRDGVVIERVESEIKIITEPVWTGYVTILFPIEKP